MLYDFQLVVRLFARPIIITDKVQRFCFAAIDFFAGEYYFATEIMFHFRALVEHGRINPINKIFRSSIQP